VTAKTDQPGGAVVWLTGLPSSGKTTLAHAVHRALRAAGRPSCLLDGDEVREAVHPASGYGPDARADQYATLADLAALLARQGLVVIVAATAHRRARAGEIAGMPGVDEPYETPEAPAVTATGGRDAAAVASIIAAVHAP